MKKLECGTTNDRAEKEALLLAWDAFSSFSTEEKLNKRLHVYSDSNTLVKTVNEWMNGWKTNGWTRKTGSISNLDLVKKIYDISSTGLLTIEHVKAHQSGSDFFSLHNREADRLANIAAQ
jgi:ribonuclease HI